MFFVLSIGNPASSAACSPPQKESEFRGTSGPSRHWYFRKLNNTLLCSWTASERSLGRLQENRLPFADHFSSLAQNVFMCCSAFLCNSLVFPDEPAIGQHPTPHQIP
jgi:hypothetical protein